MRLNAATYGLLACLVGLTGADVTDNIGPPQDGGTAPQPNSVVWLDWANLELNRTSGVVQRAVNLSFGFGHVSDVEITKVVLRRYNLSGSPDGSDDIEIVEAPIRQVSESDIPPFDSDALINQIRSGGHGTSVVLTWGSDEGKKYLSAYLETAIYLECQWRAQSSGATGKSSTQIFAVFDLNRQAAINSVNAAVAHTDSKLGAPSRQETPLSGSDSDSSPTLAPTPGSTSIHTGVSSGPTPTAGSAGLESSQKAQSGLNRNAIIGIAVGVGGGVLVIAGVLLWLFCARRRDKDTSNPHYPTQSYGSDVGVDMQGMMHDKEMPAVMESSRQSSGQGHYAPYSDRASTPPSPQHLEQHQRHFQQMQTSSSPVVTSSQTELGGNAAALPATTTSTYVHLVEEGMTPEEIRRLEEEERQLDAEIESAGRRGLSAPS